jgi:hypothetical protein
MSISNCKASLGFGRIASTTDDVKDDDENEDGGDENDAVEVVPLAADNDLWLSNTVSDPNFEGYPSALLVFLCFGPPAQDLYGGTVSSLLAEDAAALDKMKQGMLDMGASSQ